MFWYSVSDLQIGVLCVALLEGFGRLDLFVGVGCAWSSSPAFPLSCLVLSFLSVLSCAPWGAAGCPPFRGRSAISASLPTHRCCVVLSVVSLERAYHLSKYLALLFIHFTPLFLAT